MAQLNMTAEQATKACDRVMKHTPGPWTTRWDPHQPTEEDPSPSNAHSIDIVREGWGAEDASFQDYGDYWIADVHQQFSGKENGWANAKLIAAAPDMLDALIGLMQDIRNKPNDTRYATSMKIAQAAIDKATK